MNYNSLQLKIGEINKDAHNNYIFSEKFKKN